jgi:hypothetical protein
MFVGDYRPTKRVGIEELDGALRMLVDRIDTAYADADARLHFYKGAWLALRAIRFGQFEYPRDFMAVFEKDIDSYIEGRGTWDSAY